MFYPVERSEYIKAFQRQISEELKEAENRRLRREARVGRPRLTKSAVALSGATLVAWLVALVALV